MEKLVNVTRILRRGFNAPNRENGDDYGKLRDIKLSVKLLDVDIDKNREISKIQRSKQVQTHRNVQGDVCEMRHSPLRIIKLAESGSIREFQKFYFEDVSRIEFKDKHGQTALHHAAAKNHVGIVEFIVERHGGIDMKDSQGNTALHVAVLNDSYETLKCLLKYDADSTLLNNDLKAPIHLATEYNKVRILEELVKHKEGIGTTVRGRHGRTALHIAAIFDRAECIRILLSQTACCPRIACDNGYYPIHEAAKNASANALKALLDWGQSRGYAKEDMMKCYDADGNVPLHSAVHAGDIKAVKLCLESGAVISTQQHDLSTPVHLACAQGAMEIVKLMFESQNEQKSSCLSISDAQKMTPLHCAAMFDHQDLVEYLITEGADITAPDKEGRSVLLLAAARGAWNTVKILLKMGANISDHDNGNRNLLHHVVLSGGCLSDICNDIIKVYSLIFNIFKFMNMKTFHLIFQNTSELLDLLNEKDFSGCTPMHYASLNGHLKTIQSLLYLGAIINLKNNENQSPLHFAARYGRYNTVRHLLETKKGHMIINEMDGEGMTPLHIASQNGHIRVVQLLLVKGALLHRDHKGRTPLHYAAYNGYTQTMEQLLAVHSHLLDQTDRDGNTALHMASSNNKSNAVSLLLSLNCKIITNSQDMTAIDCALNYKHNEVTMAMVTHVTRSEEIMCCKTKKYSCLLEGLTAVMPDIMMAVLDRGIVKSKFSEDSKSYYIKYNFQYLQDTGKISTIVPTRTIPMPLPVMNIMVRYGREELMSHPLCVKYLETKWNSYGMYFHLINLAVYTVFLIFITVNAIQLMNDADSIKENNYIDRGSNSIQKPFCTVTSIVVLIFVALNIIKEFYQMIQQKKKYFHDVINLLEWLLYISAGIMATGHIFPEIIYLSTEYILAAIAVFLAWFNYLLYLQRFNQIGIYVVMFLEILSTLLKVMFVFSVLIIAFGLSFYILMATVQGSKEKGFYNPAISLLRVSTMMLGEIDFLGTFLKPLHQDTLPTWHQMAAASWFLVAFAILMPILLMNLLIGLAVGDIETVRRNAQMKRLTMQVELHTDLERKLPNKLLKLVDKMEIFEYPNKKCTSSYMWNTLHKWFACSREEGVETQERYFTSIENVPDDISGELNRQKKKKLFSFRLKEMTKLMDQQLQLLRLIVQKMEIRTENGDIDEGVYDYQDRPISATSYKLSSVNSSKSNQNIV
ncbi:transient receptor potential cation channel subfamily A member 1-like [Centruroides sculpturatus]|uniref:transient receptor potential cation channel subfamily A member 1-like n=1 Tax=Centruroides sculpturatus TaxID=218467 RepID=UPI000C6D4DF3|nr:transient receptor potential cation channel subfamily A member 1-like [Centruroides sculpturatus]